MNKTGGAIWKGVFINAMRDSQLNQPLTEAGQVLHALSSDAEFETYFKPLMTAYSKWVIEFNVAQLLQREEYLPRFFKLINNTKQRLNKYRLEKMKAAMNLTNYKNFLINNVDEQSEWPQLMMDRLEQNARELDEKIASVNQRKEQLEEANRVRLFEFSKRWDVYKQKMAEQRVRDQEE